MPEHPFPSPLVEVYNQYPFELVRAEGQYVFDKDGTRYTDFYGGHCVTPLGHCPPVVVQAITEQASSFLFYSNLARIPLREMAARDLLTFCGSGHEHVFFCNSGAEANENALKIAIKKTGRQTIGCFNNAFHGRTGIAMGPTDHSDWHEIYRGWQGSTIRLEPNNLDDLLKLNSEVAAVILEPIQSIGKCTVFDFEYLKALKSRCEEIGALLIFDEVQTAMGRTGVPCVSGWCGVTPNMMTFAKGLASGVPIGAVAIDSVTAQSIQKGDIAATFGGSPIAMAALRATVKEIQEQNLIERVKEREKEIREFSGIDKVEGIHGRGLLLGIRLNQSAKPVQEKLFRDGIIVGLNADPNQIHLLPPFTITSQDVMALRAALEKVLS